MYLSAEDGAVGITADISITTSTQVLSNANYQWQYVATIHNASNQAVANIVATLTLPQGVSVASKPAACVAQGLSVTCTAASLAANASEPFSLVLAATQKPAGSATARVSSNALDTNNSNNTATSAFTPLFVATDVHVEGGGKSGGASGWLWLLPLLLARLLAPLFIRKTKVISRGAALIGWRKPMLAVVLALLGAQTYAESWFAQIGVGRANSHWQASELKNSFDSSTQEVAITQLDDKRGTQELTLGYRARPWLALELGYRDWGNTRFGLTGVSTSDPALINNIQSHYPVSGKGGFVGLRFSHWQGDNLEAFARINAWQWEGDYTININNRLYAFDTKATDAVLGLGINGYFYSRYYVGAEYQTTSLEGQPQIQVGVVVGAKF